MDGCSRLGFIYRILLPLSAPGILATGLFCFVTAWNEFLFGYVLINDDARRPLTPAIMVFKGPHLTDWGALMAASVLAVVPVALFFVYLQRFLVEGLSTGAVKGYNDAANVNWRFGTAAAAKGSALFRVLEIDWSTG